MIKLHDYVLSLFLEQGILVFLLKILFDREIRVEAEILEKNRNLDSIRGLLPQGILIDIKTTQAVEPDEYHEEIESEHFSRQTLLDIILKVELDYQKLPTERMFVVGNDYNSADPGVLKAFLP